jgi:hypothetical protein
LQILDCRIITTEIFILRSGVGVARLNDWLLGGNPTKNLDWTILTQMLWRHCISPNVIETIHNLLKFMISKRKSSLLRTATNNKLCVAEAKPIHEIGHSAEGKAKAYELDSFLETLRILWLLQNIASCKPLSKMDMADRISKRGTIEVVRSGNL